MGIEPTASAWKAEVLPLYDTYMVGLGRVELPSRPYKELALTVELQSNGGTYGSRIRDLLRDRETC